MAQQHGGGYKQEPGTGDPHQHHHPHHPQQGPPQHLQHPRPPSVLHQQHHQPSPQQHGYPSSHGLPYQNGPGPSGPHQEIPSYYAHPSPYSTSSAPGPYTSAEAPEMMAAAQMTRPPYPPIYHTPQSNSPASVASSATHDQHGRSMYPPAHLQQQPQTMYYPPQSQYPPMPPQAGPSPYGQHQQHPQALGQQPNNLLLNHQAPQHAMQHPQHTQHQQTMSNSPRPKIEHLPPQQQQQQAQQPQQPQQQMQRPPTGSIVPPQSMPAQNAAQMNSNNVPGGGVNPNAAPGPIPATTPLVVRQDNNGVQWIAFEYSRDRVKMEYTIRCDVESVNVDSLSNDFKTENCVYPRACCPKEQYRGNRLVYETECNTVGWALADLNPSLRGKRGLIQRAVDSWRNSNQDSRLRSRRVRRMAKLSTRTKTANTAPAQAHIPSAPVGGAPMAQAGNMGPGGPNNMVKPNLGGMGGNSQLHHHHAHPDGGPVGPGDGSGMFHTM